MSNWIGFGVGMIIGFYIGVFVMVAVRMNKTNGEVSGA